MPLMIAAAIQWKNQQSVPTHIDPSFLFPHSPTDAYVHLTHPGACILLSTIPSSSLINSTQSSDASMTGGKKIELSGYVDSNRGLKNQVIGGTDGLVNASSDLLQVLRNEASCVQIFKLSVSFSASGAAVVEAVNSEKCKYESKPLRVHVCTSEVSALSSGTKQRTYTHNDRNKDSILCMLFQRFFSVEPFIYSTTQLHQVFSRPSFRSLCALSIFLSFQQSHSLNQYSSNSDSGGEVVRLTLVHINAQSIDQPVATLALESQSTEKYKNLDSISSSATTSVIEVTSAEWILHGFIQVTAESTGSDMAASLLFQDVGRKGFEDRVDSAALVSEKMYASLLQRLFSLYKMFIENQS